MRDQFVGDIGDFAKYGLLRALVRNGAARRLGVVWYANEDDPGSGHGGQISYLGEGNEAYRQCDPDLHGSLQLMVQSGLRRMSAVEESGILGADIPYWSGLTPTSYSQRLDWIVDALNRVKGCDLVFLDPDNGIRLEDVPDRGPVSSEHAYKNELLAFSGAAGVAVAYHTPSRHQKGVTHERQIEEIRHGLSGAGGHDGVVYAARWRRHGARTFLIICNQGSAEAVRQALLVLHRSPWGQPHPKHQTAHFTFSGPGLGLTYSGSTGDLMTLPDSIQEAAVKLWERRIR